MRVFAQKQKQNQTQKPQSVTPGRPGMANQEPGDRLHPMLHLQCAMGNQPVWRVLQSQAEESHGRLNAAASYHLGHDLAQIPIHPRAAEAIQTKLAIDQPGDIYEREADRIANEVTATPAPPTARVQPLRIQRFSGESDGKIDALPASVNRALASTGRLLEPSLREDMEQRFGHDFSRVRVHFDAAAEQSARDVNANAYTVGSHMVFGEGRYAPSASEGRRLIAHELTHVVQQSSSTETGVFLGDKEDGAAAERGNAPLKFLSSSPVHIQRDEIEMEGIDMRPRGLLAPKRVTHVTGGWVHLWRSKKDSTIRTLLGDMLARVNAELSDLRDAPVVFDPTPAATEGGFRRQEWKMGINLDKDLGRKVSFDEKASSLSVNDLAIIGDTLYHEARHAEQAFLVARQLAATIRDPDALAKKLDMPVAIARAAILAGRPGRDDPGDERIEEWAAFEPSGRYFAYWQWNESMRELTKEELEPIVTRSPQTADEFMSMADQINSTINVLSTQWDLPYKEIEKIEKLSAPKPLDTDVLAQLRRITSGFDELVKAIDVFRTAAALLERIKSHPEEREWRMLDTKAKWMAIESAQLKLFIAQEEAYLAYPHELDARHAGEAAKESILAATRPARAH